MPYTKLTDFSVKDALTTGNPAKIVKGTEIDDEFDAISTAFDGYKSTADLAASTGSTLIGTSNAQAPAYLKTVSDILNGDMVLIDRFLPSAQIAAIRAGTSTYNCAPDLNTALPSFTNGGGISAPQGRYYTTQPVVFGLNSKKIKFTTTGGAVLFVAHTGDGIDLTATNENYGGHAVEDWFIQGPNVSYPNSAAELAGTSTGAGIKIGFNDTSNSAAGYNDVLKNVSCYGFYQGMYWQGALYTKCYGGFLRYNQYGLYIDGGNTNANDWWAPTIRENRIAGIYSSGRTGGSLTNATQNRFWGGGIETNIPYRGDNPAGFSGGYPTTRNLAAIGAGGDGYGAYILNSYDWEFNGTYFENQNVDIWIGSSSDGNSAVKTRHATGGGGRVGGFKLDGASINHTKITGAMGITSNLTDANVIINNATTAEVTQFLDCSGLNFIPANLAAMPDIHNHTTSNAGTGGTPFGAIAMPKQGYYSGVFEDPSLPGSITGIGTATAALNIFGVGEIQFTGGITGNTTITTIVGGVSGQVMRIRNYQTTYAVILKSGTSGTSDIVLKNNRSVQLNKFGQEIVLYCNGQGKWYESGRNFSDSVRGYVQISGASTTIAVLFSTPSAGMDVYPDEPDALYTGLVSVTDSAGGTPAAGAWSVRIHAQTTVGFSITVQAAPGGATSFYYNWEAVR